MFLTELAEQLNRRLFRRRLLPSAKNNFSSVYLDGFEEDSVKWRDSREAIRDMRDLAAAAGSSFTRGEDHSAFIVPWDGHPNPEAHRRIAAFLADKVLEDSHLGRSTR